MKLAGLLLAGGRSSRFGSEKAVAPLGGGLLMDAPLAALQAVCSPVAVSAWPGSGAAKHARSLGLDRLFDRPDDVDGPLAGIRRGLEWADEQGADWLFLAPCDAATLTPAHAAILHRELRRGAPIVARSGFGVEPLVSIWPVGEGLAILTETLAEGLHPSVRSLLEILATVEVALADYDGANINRREDLPARLSTSARGVD